MICTRYIPQRITVPITQSVGSRSCSLDAFAHNICDDDGTVAMVTISKHDLYFLFQHSSISLMLGLWSHCQQYERAVKHVIRGPDVRRPSLIVCEQTLTCTRLRLIDGIALFPTAALIFLFAHTRVTSYNIAHNSSVRLLSPIAPWPRRISRTQNMQVYKGVNRETHEPVAIKVMTKARLGERALNMLAAEINILRTLEHRESSRQYYCCGIMQTIVQQYNTSSMNSCPLLLVYLYVKYWYKYFGVLCHPCCLITYLFLLLQLYLQVCLCRRRRAVCCASGATDTNYAISIIVLYSQSTQVLTASCRQFLLLLV